MTAISSRIIQGIYLFFCPTVMLMCACMNVHSPYNHMHKQLTSKNTFGRFSHSWSEWWTATTTAKRIFKGQLRRYLQVGVRHLLLLFAARNSHACLFKCIYRGGAPTNNFRKKLEKFKNSKRKNMPANQSPPQPLYYNGTNFYNEICILALIGVQIAYLKPRAYPPL